MTASFSFTGQFEDYLGAEKRYSEHTVKAYLKDLGQFLAFAEIAGPEELEEVSHHIIRSWIVSMIDDGVTARTVNRKLSALNTFFKWRQKMGALVKNPMTKVQGPKQQKRLPEFVKPGEIEEEKIVHLFSEDLEGVRDHLMVEIFYQTGIRLSELIGLKEDNVSASGIKVLGKRNKERIIPITGRLFSMMEEYRRLKSASGLHSGYFFVLNNGNKLYPKFVYRKINHYLGGVTNLDKKSPHVLRHTFATHMLNNGAGLETLKDILGHANLSATQVYTHNSFAQLNNIYSQAHPRGHKKN